MRISIRNYEYVSILLSFLNTHCWSLSDRSISVYSWIRETFRINEYYVKRLDTSYETLIIHLLLRYIMHIEHVIALVTTKRLLAKYMVPVFIFNCNVKYSFFSFVLFLKCGVLIFINGTQSNLVNAKTLYFVSQISDIFCSYCKYFN